MSQPDILLLTSPTMNGWKPIILLEEVGVPYELQSISFDKKEQKDPEYVRKNPNGRIPTIIDRGNDDFAVFESGAILWYIAEKYGKFLPEGLKERSEALQWLMFSSTGIAPMMGQAMYFQRIAEPQGHRDDFAIRRYVDESRRLLEVLDKRLEGREYILGSEYTLVDIATYTYARTHFWAKVSVDGLSNLEAWFDRIDTRPAVKRALQKPEPRPEFFGKGDVDSAMAANSARFKDDVKK